jgi:uncharacterized protein YdeI (YjbR/CyaY-like superfamily)
MTPRSSRPQPISGHGSPRTKPRLPPCGWAFTRKGSKRLSVTWPESVDEALCYGWIDGTRKGIDAESYVIRFTPRKNSSVWSTVNINRVKALADLGRMRPAGLAAFEKRRENRSGIYSHEQRDVELPEPYQTLLRENTAAWEFFRKQPASYRKAASWWIASAKKDDTRRGRLDKLVEYSVRAERLPQFRSPR